MRKSLNNYFAVFNFFISGATQKYYFYFSYLFLKNYIYAKIDKKEMAKKYLDLLV